VVVVVLDDVGFAQLGCYGSNIATPVIDGLAGTGIRLANFHTTALCSPTRASLLTGRNHHRVGMGRIADLALGYPGYTGEIGRQHGFLPEILRPQGYATYAVGKWHLTPEDETHMAASRATWPVGRGFDRWYGFHGGETHQFVPTLFQDNQWVAPPRVADDGYHLSEDLADRAVAMLADLRAVDADQPFLLYLATGACHSPHHAPTSWIDRYAGHFDEGWDVWRERTLARQIELGLVAPTATLSPRPTWVPAWDELSPDDQSVAARFMECFAGFLSHADDQIGRVLAFVEDLGERENTLVVLLSDNGASAEGGAPGSINDARMWNGIPAGRAELVARRAELGTATAHNNYPWGWTMAGNTPFRRWKREVHEGGVADPCIISWPGGELPGGAIRHQYTHVIDLLPTILDLVGVDTPSVIDGIEQSPIDGVSTQTWLRDPRSAPTRPTQYFEMLGSRGLYHDGWKAVTFKPLGPLYDDGIDPDAPFEDDRWELYHVAEDPTECVDLASTNPERLAELVDLWWVEARRNQVLPLDNRPLAALLDPRPRRRSTRTRYRYFPHASPVPEAVAVNVRNRAHTITADVVLPSGEDAAVGVLLAQGSVLGGWSLYLFGGCLRYVHNLAGKRRDRIVSSTPVEAGEHRLGFAFVPTADFQGVGRLYVDEALVGEGSIELFTPARFSITGNGVTCGYELGPAVSDDYTAPFRFTGSIRRVVVDVSGDAYRDVEGDLRAIFASQ
jgi:arylsulfatase